jgi:hypothetical protein
MRQQPMGLRVPSRSAEARTEGVWLFAVPFTVCNHADDDNPPEMPDGFKPD